jgi:acyl-CoA synthetase (AMP-forming)/AMP-acid ligase II
MQANSKIVETGVRSQGRPTLRPDHNVSNWGELLRWRSAQQPHQVGYTFLADGQLGEQSFTYRDLDRRARSIAAW